MPRILPARPSLDHLRREARALQRACLAGDPDAVRRLESVFPNADPRELALTKAQAVVARDYGFASWPVLKAKIEAGLAPRPRSAAAIDAEMLAERWFDLAARGELRDLVRAMTVGKGRIEAARAVMSRQRKRYRAFVQVLVEGLSSPADPLRFAFAHHLDQFGDASTRAPLARLMDDRTPRVRWMAMHALSCHACGEKPGELEPQYRARIVEAALSDPSPHVRRHAAVALAMARECSAIPILRAILERETDTKLLRGVAWALSELTRAAKPAPAGV